MIKKIHIIKAGTTFQNILSTLGDFDLWTIRSMGLTPEDVNIVDIEQNVCFPSPGECKGVIVTGSHSMVTDHFPWSDLLIKWVSQLINDEVPFLGICYGHQLFAQAMGGEVGYHHKGKEIGTVNIHLLEERVKDPLFRGMPEKFKAHVTHAQSILSLPENAIILAKNNFESHQAIRIGKCAWGLQFHPEYNVDIMKAYIVNQANELESSGMSIDDIMATVNETPDSTNILKRFTDFITN